MRWRAPMQKSRAIKGAKDGRRAVHEWAVMSRLALGDGVPLRDVLQAANTDMDAILSASVCNSDGVVKAIVHGKD